MQAEGTNIKELTSVEKKMQKEEKKNVKKGDAQKTYSYDETFF